MFYRRSLWKVLYPYCNLEYFLVHVLLQFFPELYILYILSMISMGFAIELY